MKIKALEKAVVTASVSASLTLPFLPVGLKSWASGYYLLVVAIMQISDSTEMVCITTGFGLVVASMVFAFVSKWGTAAVLSIAAFCVFGSISACQLFYFKGPIGYGLIFLLAILIMHSSLSMKWYLQSRQIRSNLPH